MNLNPASARAGASEFPAGGQPAAPEGARPWASAVTRAFTLIEMLVVIAIIGIVAAITVPALKNMQKSDAIAAATRQMQDALARARQFAISQRTTVYMVFVPVSFWTDPNYGTVSSSFGARERQAVTNLLAKQLTGYNFVSLRQVGGQPGQYLPQYLDEWRTLPEGMFIAGWKFAAGSVTFVNDPPPPLTPQRSFKVYGFNYTNNIPFPTPEAAPGIWVPYLAFNHLGQLVEGDGVTVLDQEIIPLARGTVVQPLDANKRPTFNPVTLDEKPAGNSTNAFTLVVVDGLTGRARVERQQLP